MDKDLPFKLALSQIQGIGANTFKLLLSYEESAEKIFSSRPSYLQRIPGVGPRTCELIKSVIRPEELGHNVIKNMEKIKGRIIYCKGDEYPQRLLNCPDAPAFLFQKGEMNLNHEKAISIVGTRKATNYGLKMVEEFLASWSNNNPLVISGLAYGIDIKAHRSSMDNNLQTVGVMAGGLDKIYPYQHKEFAKRMFENGGLLTEYVPGTSPEPARFPARNRLIAGLSDACIIIEAASKGGALITAEMASGYHREVFAVPGRVTDHFSRGCNDLIRDQKAIPLIQASDLEENLNWDRALEDQKNLSSNQLSITNTLEGEEKYIFELINEKGSLQLEDISWRSGISIPKLSALLLELELQGLIRTYPGNLYATIDN